MYAIFGAAFFTTLVISSEAVGFQNGKFYIINSVASGKVPSQTINHSPVNCVGKFYPSFNHT